MKRVIQINLSNKVFYSLLTLSLILLIGIAYAYGTNDPNNFGHSVNEIESLPTTKIVRHSQTNSTPDCPSGWNKLWEGYSYGGGYAVGGRTISQPLGDTGSCLKDFRALPFMSCLLGNACNYDQTEYSMWLTTNITDKTYSGEDMKTTIIGRCSVCEKPAPLLVMHSQTTEIPNCPDGWNELWNGYSYMAGFLHTGVSSGQSLGDTGSCLEIFYPIPFIECSGTNPDSCNYLTTDDGASWIIKKDMTDMGSIFELENLEPLISKCAVCSK
jgi:integrin beta 8